MVDTVKYWPKNKPVPKGWKFSVSLAGHHGHYSILIEKEKPSPQKK